MALERNPESSGARNHAEQTPVSGIPGLLSWLDERLGLPEIRELLGRTSFAPGRLHALWTLAGLGALVMPIVVLVLTAIAVSVHAGRAGPLNSGPHGFSEILYAFTSQGNNNGSAFGGLTGNTTFYNVLGSIDMLIGRYGIMIPAIALGGVLAAKPAVPVGLGTFRTDNSMFVGLTIGVIIIIGGLTFFPSLALGPIVEQLSHGKFF